MQLFDAWGIVNTPNWEIINKTNTFVEVDPVGSEKFDGYCFPVAVALATNTTIEQMIEIIRSIEPNACMEGEGTHMSTMIDLMWRHFQVTRTEIKGSSSMFSIFAEQHTKGTYIVAAHIHGIGGHVSLLQDGVEYGTFSNEKGWVDCYWKLD